MASMADHISLNVPQRLLRPNTILLIQTVKAAKAIQASASLIVSFTASLPSVNGIAQL